MTSRHWDGARTSKNRIVHSRGEDLCKFIGTKESVCIRKEFNSHRIGLGHQHGRCFIVLGHQYGRRDVMCKRSIEHHWGGFPLLRNFYVRTHINFTRVTNIVEVYGFISSVA